MSVNHLQPHTTHSGSRDRHGHKDRVHCLLPLLVLYRVVYTHHRHDGSVDEGLIFGGGFNDVAAAHPAFTRMERSQWPPPARNPSGKPPLRPTMNLCPRSSVRVRECTLDRPGTRCGKSKLPDRAN